MKLIIKVLFKAVKVLITAILAPIDAIVYYMVPDTRDIITNVNTFFTSITNGVLWVKSWIPFTSNFWLLISSVIVLRFSIPLATHAIKLAVKWYNALKP